MMSMQMILPSMKLRPNAKIVYFADKVLLALQRRGAALH